MIKPTPFLLTGGRGEGRGNFLMIVIDICTLCKHSNQHMSDKAYVMLKPIMSSGSSHQGNGRVDIVRRFTRVSLSLLESLTLCPLRRDFAHRRFASHKPLHCLSSILFGLAGNVLLDVILNRTIDCLSHQSTGRRGHNVTGFKVQVALGFNSSAFCAL